ncbi:MAG: hypothetical protein JNL17_02395 [Cyclobacteriaceae bacterium]|nr:hypothetical protein [Cyclobacteriaceae bacterium]
MIRVVFALMGLIIPVVATAQISIGDFLATATSAPAVVALQQQDAFLAERSYRLGPIQRMEFRTISNQLDPQRQVYGLRINPANPWEVRNNRLYFETYHDVVRLDQQRELKMALYQRYLSVVQFVFASEENRLREQQQEVAAKLLNTLRALQHSNRFDADDFLNFKLEYIEKAADAYDAWFSVSDQQKQAEALDPRIKTAGIAWRVDQLIPLTGLAQLIDSVNAKSVTGGDLAYRAGRIALAEQDWKLEKSNIPVGFLQTQYQPFRLEQDRVPWNISVGVTLPLFNPNKGDMAKRKLEILEAQADLDESKRLGESSRQRHYSQLKNVLRRYHELDSLEAGLDLNVNVEVLEKLGEGNPLIALKIQASQARLSMTRLRMKKEIYLAYLEFLLASEVLQQPPLINYLSPTRQPIPR